MDGSYAPVQCFDSTGCWCVNSQGKIIPNTTRRTGRPSCGKIGKSNTRRSPPRNDGRLIEGGGGGGGGIGQQKRRDCSRRVDRILFNTNLIKMLQSEYLRFLNTNPRQNPITDKVILDWKFSVLDTNNNSILDKNEYRELKRIVKKVSKYRLKYFRRLLIQFRV